jgi:bacterioferritin
MIEQLNKTRFIETTNESTEMNLDTVIGLLNEIIKHEWTGVAQYSQAGFMVQGLWREVYSEKFFEAAEESFGHAKKIGEKIVALGGVPVAERNQVKQSNDVQQLLEYGLEFESKAVELYCKALAACEDDKPLSIFLEDILIEEQEGVDELTKILREFRAIKTTSRAAQAS